MLTVTKEDRDFMWKMAQVSLPSSCAAVYHAWKALPEMERDVVVSKILLLQSDDSARKAGNWGGYWEPIQDVFLALADIEPTWRKIGA